MTDIEFERGSGNVFADLGLEDAEELYTRAALGSVIRNAMPKPSRSFSVL